VALIKQLIDDLATDKVPISTALSTAKVIAKRLGVENFSNWVTFELNGYKGQDAIPDYRIFNADIEGDVADSWGNKHTGVVIDLQEIGRQLGIKINEHKEFQSIQTIEYVLENSKTTYLQAAFPQSIVSQIPVSDNGKLLNAYKKIPTSFVKNIIVQVKQRLLDLLLDIESKYPDNLLGDKSLNKEQAEVVNNMITYNLYGNHNAAPLAVGKAVKQSQHVKVTQTSIQNTLNELEKLGVEKKDLSELKSILEDTRADRKSLGQKVTGWIGKLATSAVEKGIELQLPAIMELLHHYLK
jgi:hypothetical protein